MKYIVLSLAITASLVNAFAVLPKTSLSLPFSTNQRMNILQMSNDDSVDTTDEESASPPSPGVDKAWKHIKKPMLRIGGKGVTETHGNSLRELLNAHTAVKVKINTHKLGSLEAAFDEIKGLAEKSGEIEGIELIHIRNSDNMIMFGKEGTMDMIRSGEFPPPPPEPYVREPRDTDEEWNLKKDKSNMS